MFVVTAVSAATAGNNPLDNYRSPLFNELSQVPVLVDSSASGGGWSPRRSCTSARSTWC
jgi:hypothetical protein